MREQQCKEQDSSGKHAAGSGNSRSSFQRTYSDTVSGSDSKSSLSSVKSASGQDGKEDLGKTQDPSKIGGSLSTGDGVEGGSGGGGDGKEAQNQLSKLFGMIQNQSSISIDQMAKSLNINVDSQTSQLLGNLQQQLMMAVSTMKKPTNPNVKDLDMPNTGAVGSLLGNLNSNKQPTNSGPLMGGAVPFTSASSSSSSILSRNMSGGSGGGAGLFPDPVPRTGGQPGSELSSQGYSKHAGVKAALAQLLAQQGMAVTMRGQHFGDIKGNNPVSNNFQNQGDTNTFQRQVSNSSMTSNLPSLQGNNPRFGGQGSMSGGNSNFDRRPPHHHQFSQLGGPRMGFPGSGPYGSRPRW